MKLTSKDYQILMLVGSEQTKHQVDVSFSFLAKHTDTTRQWIARRLKYLDRLGLLKVERGYRGQQYATMLEDDARCWNEVFEIVNRGAKNASDY